MYKYVLPVLFCLGAFHIWGGVDHRPGATAVLQSVTADTRPNTTAPGTDTIIISHKRVPAFTKLNKRDAGNESVYKADISEGIIGASVSGVADDPFDNIFHVRLPENPLPDDELILKYELYGVSSHTGISRSINEALSAGGELVVIDSSWKLQQETISYARMRKGDNIIRFTIPPGAAYGYRVRNLFVQHRRSVIHNPAIIINSPEHIFYGNYACIKGMVQLPAALKGTVQLFCNDRPVPVDKNEFAITFPNAAGTDSIAVLLKALLPDGTILEKQLIFNNRQVPDITLLQPAAGEHRSGKLIPGKPFSLYLNTGKGAGLLLPENGLAARVSLSVTSLREIDMPPVGGELVNVTKDAAGYRFLPHGTKFRKPVKVILPFDPALIPEGYNKDDVRTYFFDEQKREWLQLPLDTIMSNQLVISSFTTHFTDMIAGIIKVPESPQTQGYTPTTIKDIKAANPSLNIEMIEPPAANNMGTASLSYKLKLPGGRQGMQPVLTLQYNNEGGNGWTGIGWGINIPAISIETRWGAPRYDPALETETYTLAGEQLAPLAHRDAFVPRVTNRQYHPRIEGNFQRITRHGSGPADYWWEVTDKEGTRNYYGGTPATGMMNNGVLRDANGNIGHWALLQTVDLNGNTVNYVYQNISDAGLAGGTVPGQQLYISQINYTGYRTTAGPYLVEFIRDRQLGETRRRDVEINGRLGFKMVTADLLRQVKISFNGQPIRSYELSYREGAFYKTLLQNVTEKDAAGAVFYTHPFTYYDDVNAAGGYTPFSAIENWSPAGDNIKGDIQNPVPGFGNESSVLSTAKSKNSGRNLAVTIGIENFLPDKSLTVGGSKGSGSGSTEGLVSMVDITGDGLPDKVFKQGGQLWYRANQGAGITGFGVKRPITGRNNFSTGNTKSTSSGFEVNVAIAFIGNNRTNSTTTTNNYFSDFNGDGLIDICSNGVVYFNRPGITGDPVFLPSSASTPNPITGGSNVSPQFLTPDTALQSQNEIDFPLQDAVRFWQAPFTGNVSITAPVQLVNTGAGSIKKDGIRVGIQTGGAILWSANINAGDFSIHTPSGVNNIPVSKGQRIYFRLQSRFNGEEDLVNWDPVMQYNTAVSPPADANARSSVRYQASQDFVLHYGKPYKLVKPGTVRIDGNFFKGITSDTVTLQVVKRTAGVPVTVLQQSYACSTLVNSPVVLSSLPVLANDELLFYLQSDSYTDRAAVNWEPRYEYTAFADATPVTDLDGNPTVRVFITPNNENYNNWQVPTPLLINTIRDTIYIKPLLTGAASVNGTVTFTVKSTNQVRGKSKIQLTGGVMTPAPDSFRIIRNANETLYCEYNAPDSSMSFTSLRYLRIKDSSYVDLLGNTVNVVLRDTLPAGLFIQPRDHYMGTLFRGWGQFSFKGVKFDNTPLDETRLNTNAMGGYSFDPNMYTDSSLFYLINSAANTDFIPMFADPVKKQWVGFDSSVFVSALQQSSARLFLYDVTEDSLMTGGGVKVVNKITRTVTKSTSLGFAGSLGIFGGSVSRSVSKSNTSNVLDMQDLNLDRHPDVLYDNKVQYTLPTGGLENNTITHNLGTSLYEGKSKGYSLGGSANISDAKSKNTASGNANDAAENAASGSGMTISGGVNVGENDDASVAGWIDINNDGLPDKVYSNGNVCMNLGYTFTAPENWGITNIELNTTEDKGINASLGISLGFNLVNGSFQGGGSLQQSSGKGFASFNDVNGDGLIDKLAINASGVLLVQLNRGNGFSAPIAWNGLTGVRKNSSTGESTSFAFTITIPIPIPFLPLKICINPSWSNSVGISRENFQVSDIDGDGFADILQSANDSNLLVNRSTIGRTNMLRSVQRPMGGNFVLDYERLGNTYNLPQSKWVLKNVEITDGVPGDGIDTMRNSFIYTGGYYDRREREFFGFKTVTTHQLNTAAGNTVYRSTIQQFFNNSYYTKGLQQSTWLQNDAGNRFTQTNNQYDLRLVADSVYFPALVRTDKLFYEGAATPGVSTYTQMDYDALGNVNRIADAGDGSAQDMMIADITYHDNDPLYIKSIPASIKVTTTNGVQRQRSTTIDAQGNIVRISQQINATTSALYTMLYDQYGNLNRIIRPVNHRGQRMWYEYTYDALTHTYVTKVDDAFGYSSSSTYDLRFGQLLSTLSMNNESIQYKLDDRGRIISIRGPYEIAAGKPYTIAFEYFHSAAIPYAITHHYDPEYNADINTITFMDGMGRALQVKKQVALFTGKNQPDDIRMTVSGRVFYDAFGRAVRNLYPVTEPIGPANILLNATSGNLLSYSAYDVLDRNVITQLADNAATINTYGITGGLFSTTVRDALNNTKRTLTDVRERTRQTDLFGGPNGTITTRFQYNALSELMRVLDVNNNATTYTYDYLGRKLSILHPDAGLVEMRYDAAGNMIQKITPQIRKEIPNGGAINYIYDYERLSEIDYPRQYQNHVTYKYGGPNTGAKTGRLVLQEDASGGEEYYYGKLGEVIKNIRTVMVNSVFYTTYVSEQEYDTWNRIKKMTYADSEVVLYHYNRGGSLHSMEGSKKGSSYSYVQQLGYDEYEQRVYLLYGNGTDNKYRYDSLRRRLTLLEANTATNRNFINNSYNYDAVSNILGIVNNVSRTPGQLGGYAAHRYQYDNLYRLTLASGVYRTAPNDSDWYSMAMRYDNLYNITQKTMAQPVYEKSYTSAYTYSATAPHQPVKIGLYNFTYDANGNQLTYSGRQNFWDEENRLMANITNGVLSRYSYDAKGERVIKSSGNLQGNWINGAPAGIINHDSNYTVYVSPYLVCRRTGFTKHYYIENQRITTKVGTGRFTNISFPQAKLTAGGIDYVQRQANLRQQLIAHYASLNLSPGPPIDKYFYMHPYNSGIAAPILVDSSSATIPPGWPGYPGNTTPPPLGPPVFVNPIPKNDSVHAGYGFTGTGYMYEQQQYFYHPDHLGSTNYITNVYGQVSQHQEYSAFGETFIDEHSGTNKQPYLYNAKELDAETGLYYYGARYYNPRLSVWLSTDPMMEKYPGLSPYNYTLLNPVRLVDPDGKLPIVKDIRGLEIASHWLFGGGEKKIIKNDPKWTNYMNNNAMLNKQIQSNLSQIPITESSGKITTHAEIEDGYTTGYEMLHGSNKNVGDFVINWKRESTTIDESNGSIKSTFSLKLEWHDIIDPNNTYAQDKKYSSQLKKVFTPKDYEIHIYWEGKQEITRKKDESKTE